jgi:hypothetical protein
MEGSGASRVVYATRSIAMSAATYCKRQDNQPYDRVNPDGYSRLQDRESRGNRVEADIGITMAES